MSAAIEEKTQRGLKEILFLSVAVVALFLFISLVTFNHEDAGWTHSGTGKTIFNACGVTGAWLADFSLSIFGITAYLFPLMIAWQGYALYKNADNSAKQHWLTALRWLGFFATVAAGSAIFYMHLLRIKFDLPASTGGVLGEHLGEALYIAFGNSGATLILLAVFLAGITLFTGISWLTIIDFVGKYSLILAHTLMQQVQLYFNQRADRQSKQPLPDIRQAEIIPEIKDGKPQKSPEKSSTLKIAPVMSMPEISEQAVKEKQVDLFDTKAGALPPLSLLDERDTQVKGYSKLALEDMSRLVEEILQDFNVVVEVVAVNPGPVVTRFEIQPAAGVKVSRISGLAKDLARALSVTSVRIVEVIPGKSVIGLEIPNQERELVSFREVLSTRAFEKSKSPLSLVMGKDISGVSVIADLGKMPHLLVAGTTGSGKSVAINTMILSLLYKSTPDQVRMIMVDPKMLELSVYEGIPHLLTPVVTDMKEAANALRWGVAEMERRYKLMSKLGVRNIKGFNDMVLAAEKRGEPIRDPLFTLDRPLEEGEEFPLLTTLPSIVIIIDELADMMMIVGKKVEELIARLAQKARAAGIHLILATQRPSVDVLTGLIKANVPTRVSFQVSSRIDSRTVLDQGGAESLLGNGDMLFLPPGTSIPIRAHGAFVDDHEVHNVVEFLKQTGPANYLAEITEESSTGADGFSAALGGDAESDELYDEAVKFVTDTRKASISSVQRRFRIGYNRAARLIEDMEAAGVVSAAESNGARQVLAPPAPAL